MKFSKNCRSNPKLNTSSSTQNVSPKTSRSFKSSSCNKQKPRSSKEKKIPFKAINQVLHGSNTENGVFNLQDYVDVLSKMSYVNHMKLKPEEKEMINKSWETMQEFRARKLMKLIFLNESNLLILLIFSKFSFNRNI